MKNSKYQYCCLQNSILFYKVHPFLDSQVTLYWRKQSRRLMFQNETMSDIFPSNFLTPSSLYHSSCNATLWSSASACSSSACFTSTIISHEIGVGVTSVAVGVDNDGAVREWHTVTSIKWSHPAPWFEKEVGDMTEDTTLIILPCMHKPSISGNFWWLLGIDFNSLWYLQFPWSCVIFKLNGIHLKVTLTWL